MALKSTIYKANIQLADLDRGHFEDYALTLARHPSENDERLMVRLLAFMLYASPTLAFGRGLSTADEADLHDIDAAGQIFRWIDVGLPDEKAIRQACHKARSVIVLAYGARAAEVWWSQTADKVERLDNLRVLYLLPDQWRDLAQLAGRNMRLQCTIQEGIVYLGDGEREAVIEPKSWFGKESG